MTEPKRQPHTMQRPFHPGEDRHQEGIYLAFDAAAHDATSLEPSMAYQTAGTWLTAILVLLELLLFFYVFGPWGLLAIVLSTAVYTLVDKRARTWVIDRLKSNLDG